MNQGQQLSVRCQPGNPDHHLWNNNGTFWCHYTVHLPDYTKQRRRVSLRTHDVRDARQRRDSLLASLVANLQCRRAGEVASC